MPKLLVYPAEVAAGLADRIRTSWSVTHVAQVRPADSAPHTEAALAFLTANDPTEAR